MTSNLFERYKKVTEALKRATSALALEQINRSPSCQAGVVRDCQCTDCVLESCRAIVKEAGLKE